MPGSTSRGTSQTKPELLAPLVKTKLKLFFPALTPSRSFTGSLFWLSNTQVDSELAACLAHKSKGGVAGCDPVGLDLDRITEKLKDKRGQWTEFYNSLWRHIQISLLCVQSSVLTSVELRREIHKNGTLGFAHIASFK